MSNYLDLKVSPVIYDLLNICKPLMTQMTVIMMMSKMIMMSMITIGRFTNIRFELSLARTDLERLHLFASAKVETNTGNGINS